jgi:hypothetical protein
MAARPSATVSGGRKPASTDASATSHGPFGVATPFGYEWNLPPHNWSLPVKPVAVDNIAGNFMGAVPDNTRRGRMWFFQSAGDINKVGVTNSKTSVNSAAAATVTDPNDPQFGGHYNFGFQFLWNPNTISSSVNMNTDFTPGTGDIFKAVAGAYPSQETLTFTITIDRTNDFACFKPDFGAVSLDAVTKYYGNFYTKAKQPPLLSQVSDMLSQGTMSDIEYLFKTQNGYGTGSGKDFWSNLLGKPTADVGYMIPNLVALQLGPDESNLSYVGFMNNLNINHTAFTEKMIPIRSDVTIQFSCFSGSGVASA